MNTLEENQKIIEENLKMLKIYTEEDIKELIKEEIKKSHGEINLFDCVLNVCQNIELHPEEMAKLVPKSVISKLEQDCIELNLIKNEKDTFVLDV